MTFETNKEKPQIEGKLNSLLKFSKEIILIVMKRFIKILFKNIINVNGKIKKKISKSIEFYKSQFGIALKISKIRRLSIRDIKSKISE